MAKTLIRFDWAMKRLLRQKSNFAILEGFLSELLREDITIKQILESESNQELGGLKFNRVDILALNARGQLIIIEMKTDSEKDYFYRMLFATSKAVVEHFGLSEPYQNIKKVYSINIVYFNLGQGEDYVYHGKTEFKGLHTGDLLGLSLRQQKSFSLDNIFEIYPEYYIIKINNFNNLAKDTLDEWIYYLKNNEIKPDFRAKGLALVQQKLEFEGLSLEERAVYIKAIENKTIERDVFETALEEATEKAEEKGMAKGLEQGQKQGLEQGQKQGLEQGRSEATKQGILQALRRGKLTIPEIAEDFGVTPADVLALQQTLAE